MKNKTFKFLLALLIFLFVMIVSVFEVNSGDTEAVHNEQTLDHKVKTDKVKKIKKKQSKETKEKVKKEEIKETNIIENKINEEKVETIKTEAPAPEAKETESSNDNEQNKLISLGTFKLTAFCSCHKCCGEYALNRPVDENGKEIVVGSSGKVLKQGVSIAVDTNIIPHNTSVFINNKEYIAHDTGGAIKGNRIDVYFDNHQDALDFGVQHTEVFIYAN